MYGLAALGWEVVEGGDPSGAKREDLRVSDLPLAPGSSDWQWRWVLLLLDGRGHAEEGGSPASRRGGRKARQYPPTEEPHNPNHAPPVAKSLPRPRSHPR